MSPPDYVATLLEQGIGPDDPEPGRAAVLRDPLTGLPNGRALSAWLREATWRWIAFVEIDHLKYLNDAFGYTDADRMLLAVAGALSEAALATGGVPFRRHGDELYLGGQGRADAAALEDLRERVAAIRIETARGAMACTVSIGWGERQVLGVSPLKRLEAAVAIAKHTRNRVVQIDDTPLPDPPHAVRADCRDCGTRFSLVVPAHSWREQPLHCPNCGTSVDR